MSSAKYPEQNHEQVLLRSQFINDINLVSMMLGCEFRPILVMKYGAILPAIKVKRSKRATFQSVIEVKKIYLEKKEEYYRFMGMDQNTPVVMADRHVTWKDKMISYVWPAKALWRIYKQIQDDYGLAIRPVVIYHPTATYAHYEVLENPKKKSTPTPIRKLLS